MSAPGSSMKFLGVDSNQLDLTEKKSSQRNNLHQYFTASEILSAQSSSTDTDLFFVDAMTTASLNTSTYNNGTGGVGATITADANGALGVVDGYTVVVNDIIAVKNQANGFENGIYEVTTLGDGSNPFVLTRVSYYDATDEVYPSLVTVVNGDTNGSLYYLQTTENPTIGTDSLVFETSTAPVTSSSETQVFFVNTATSANLSGTYADGTDAELPGSGATIKFTGGGVTEVINGVTLVVNDILLVKDQTNAEENGVYRVTKVNNGTGNLKTLTREDVYADNIYPILVHVSDANSDYHKNIYTSTSSSVVVNADVGTENVSYELNSPLEVIQVACSDETTVLSTGVKTTFRMPFAMTVEEVRASLTTAGTGAALVTVDINKGDAPATILSTKITIDASETTSETAATPPVLSSTSLSDDEQIQIEIDTIDTDNVAAGLKVSIIGRRA
jgi:hypothetical protein